MAEDTVSQAVTHHVGPERQRLEHLDMLRGVAALEVCMGHTRTFVFVDYLSNPGHGLWLLPFYALTGLGEPAVMVFFALSGFLVGGPALRRIHERRWNFPDYAIHRFTRLWTALLPALLMAGLLDWIGWHYLQLRGYAGEYYGQIFSGPLPGQHVDLSLPTFLGNAAFLEGLFVPIFGTDGPLWSLSFEFAYYFTFPLAWLALRGGVGWPWRILCAAICVAALILYPRVVPGLGTIWLMGALGYLAKERVAALSTRAFIWLGLAAIVALLLSFPLTLRYGNAGNVIFGAACALALPCIVRLPNRGGLYGRIAWGLSEISFTLYVVHFPFALLLWLALLAPTQFTVGAASMAIWLTLMAVTIGYAAGMWWLFERNTGRIRGAAQRFFGTARG